MALFLFFTTFFAFVMALGQLVKGIKLLNLLLAGIFFSGGANLLFLVLFQTQEIFNYPQAFFMNIPFAYFLGPLLFLYLKFLSKKEAIFHKIYFLHFVPGILSFLYMIPLWTLPRQKKIEILTDMFFYKDFSFLFYLTILPVISFFAYFLALSIEHGGILKEKKAQVNFYFAFMLSIWAFGIVSGFYTFLFSSLGSIKISSLVLAISILYLYLLNQRYPDYMQIFAKSIRKNKEQKSILKNIDLSLLEKKIEKLFHEEKIFIQEDLTLAALSKELEITPHQLSKFLNDKKSSNFNSFLNGYRVQEAKRLIAEKQNFSIIEIAYACGFHSLSVFNATFKKNTGVTPSAFKKIIHQKKKDPSEEGS